MKRRKNLNQMNTQIRILQNKNNNIENNKQEYTNK